MADDYKFTVIDIYLAPNEMFVHQMSIMHTHTGSHMRRASAHSVNVLNGLMQLRACQKPNSL